MNIALPAIVLFLVLLPGFVARARFKRDERLVLDYSPFGMTVGEALIWTAALHGTWLAITYVFFGRYLDLALLLGLTSSDHGTQSASIKHVGAQQSHICAYFVTMLAAAWTLPAMARSLIQRRGWDRSGMWCSGWLRINEAPWYYILNGTDFRDGEKRGADLIWVAAVVEVGKEAYLYNGLLIDYFFNESGQLDRLILAEVRRRPFERDKDAVDDPSQERFYRVDGHYFVLRYEDAITLNLLYVTLSDLEAVGSAAGTSSAQGVGIALTSDPGFRTESVEDR